MPKNVCVCKYHGNINLMIEVLHTHDKDFPKDHKELIVATTCNKENIEVEACQMGYCQDCQKLCTVQHLVELLGSREETIRAWYISYLRWEEVEDGEGKERLRKVQKNDSIYTILEQLASTIPSFRIHRLVKVQQDRRFNNLHDLKEKDTVLLQFDFSENPNIQEQDEVQTAHWYHLTCSLFTACAWVNGNVISFAVVSDYMHHNKYLTFISLINIIKKLFKQFKIITNIHLFSNGAAQHFKQRFLLNAITLIPQFLGLPYEQIDVSYDMFATSHGKGAVDGVGGSFKRMVMSDVTCRKEIIANSEDYARVAKSLVFNVVF